MDTSTSNQVIRLAPMPQLAEALEEEDDWTGLTDAAARRRKQNRLNQRAYRRRKAQETSPRETSQHATHQAPSQNFDYQKIQTGCSLMTPQCQQVLRIILPYLQRPNTGASSSSSSSTTTTPQFPTHAHAPFPLSADHLIPLIQLNVLLATLTNLSLLSSHLHPVSIPPACATTISHLSSLLPPAPLAAPLPPCLAPTALQQSTPHGLWIDIIPSPTMRDNCIRLAHRIDEDDLCADLIGGLYDGRADCHTMGWIVWRDPWDVSGWEVTEGFVRKWGFLLEGCEQVIEAANRWRAIRGEDALVVEV